MSRPSIVTRGSMKYPRYLVERDGEFWDGEQFVPNEKDGLLYHHFAPASLVVRGMLLEVDGETYEYVVPLQITVKAGEEPDLGELVRWLHKVVVIEMDYDAHGAGPVKNSIGSTYVEWDQLKKESVT